MIEQEALDLGKCPAVDCPAPESDHSTLPDACLFWWQNTNINTNTNTNTNTGGKWQGGNW